MARGMHLLATRTVQTAGDGDLLDGAGLTIRVRGGSATAVFRYTAADGRRREMGLGKIHRDNISVVGRCLTAARDQAEAARRLLRDGIDPIDARKRKRADARRALELRKAENLRERATLARVARDYHERIVEPQRTTKQAAQWIASLGNHVPAELWHKPIDEITPPMLLDAVEETQARIPETARRIRQRLEVIFDEAEFRKLCTGNPARAIRRKLGEAKKGRERGEFAALPFGDVPAFVRRLREQPGVAARCLEFALLTASRTGEVLGATWPEFDIDAATWTITGARMKGGETHVVYLSPRAMEILEEAHPLGEPFVFPSPMLKGRSLSNMSMLATLRRLGVHEQTTVHGLCRAAFSTWAYENAIRAPGGHRGLPRSWGDRQS